MKITVQIEIDEDDLRYIKEVGYANPDITERLY